MFDVFSIQFSRYGRRITGMRLADVLHVISTQEPLPGCSSHAKACIKKMSGSRLLSHAVSSIVPSAARIFTVVFGMGTGVPSARIATRQIFQ